CSSGVARAASGTNLAPNLGEVRVGLLSTPRRQLLGDQWHSTTRHRGAMLRWSNRRARVGLRVAKQRATCSIWRWVRSERRRWGLFLAPLLLGRLERATSGCTSLSPPWRHSLTRLRNGVSPSSLSARWRRIQSMLANFSELPWCFASSEQRASP